MDEIGEILRKARLEQGKSLADISKETKIQERLLIALEEGDASAFAGEVYYRGALRNYAEAVGLNYHELKKSLAVAKQSPEAEAGQKDKEREEVNNNSPIFKPKGPILSFNALVWIILFLIVVCGGLWYFTQSDKTPADFLNDVDTTVNNNDTEYDLSDNDLPFAEGREKEEEVDLVEEARLVLSQEASRRAVFTVTGVEQLSLNIIFREKCWVRLHGDDALIEEKNYLPGEEIKMQAEESFEILFGFPQGAEMKINDLPVPGLEDRTSPYTIRIEKEQ